MKRWRDRDSYDVMCWLRAGEVQATKGGEQETAAWMYSIVHIKLQRYMSQ